MNQHNQFLIRPNTISNESKISRCKDQPKLDNGFSTSVIKSYRVTIVLVTQGLKIKMDSLEAYPVYTGMHMSWKD